MVQNNLINISTFVSPIYTFSLALNILVYTPSQGKNREKYLNQITYQDKKGQLWREINTFLSISSLIGYVFSIFWRITYDPTPSEIEIEVFIPAPTQ